MKIIIIIVMLSVLAGQTLYYRPDSIMDKDKFVSIGLCPKIWAYADTVVVLKGTVVIVKDGDAELLWKIDWK